MADSPKRSPSPGSTPAPVQPEGPVETPTLEGAPASAAAEGEEPQPAAAVEAAPATQVLAPPGAQAPPSETEAPSAPQAETPQRPAKKRKYEGETLVDEADPTAAHCRTVNQELSVERLEWDYTCEMGQIRRLDEEILEAKKASVRKLPPDVLARVTVWPTDNLGVRPLRPPPRSLHDWVASLHHRPPLGRSARTRVTRRKGPLW